MPGMLLQEPKPVVYHGLQESQCDKPWDGAAEDRSLKVNLHVQHVVEYRSVTDGRHRTARGLLEKGRNNRSRCRDTHSAVAWPDY